MTHTYEIEIKATTTKKESIERNGSEPYEGSRHDYLRPVTCE